MRGVHIVEHDDSRGCKTTFQFTTTLEKSGHKAGTECRLHQVVLEKHSNAADANAAFKRFLSNVFLPAGYPHSVSPGKSSSLFSPGLVFAIGADSFTRLFTIWNAAQACCSSLASLLASRAVLEGFGVGKQSASATDAILVTVAQDVVSRLTTIIFAYWLGTSLFPEAKTYRFLADILNDMAIVLDVLSPQLDKFVHAFTGRDFGSGIRVTALCLSGSFRALCGIVAGGSKAAVTMHFASDSVIGSGDIGDLNAKDSSKETVLALLGLLLGFVILPYVNTTRTTHTLLAFLLAAHLGANFAAVRGLTMRTLNRQRACIAWSNFRALERGNVGEDLLHPERISRHERIFISPSRIRDGNSGTIIGRCTIGCSLSSLLRIDAETSVERLTEVSIHELVDLFKDERYALWCSRQSRHRSPDISIALKAGHTPIDHLRGWLHACEIARLIATDGETTERGEIHYIRAAHREVDRLFGKFTNVMRHHGWKIDEGTLVVGLPPILSFDIDCGPKGSPEGRP
ncbi:DUF647-domain-containing protein [Thelephora ganbajun]|uniref:DUF647-domain-containing protein n=1 Tax=Thelephora ganbajun TaxID=370292 RepID=A0ACB6ZVX2_THEGA|nr:DUF647-domain-containing protein [Thelephora ganbajun]